MFQSAPASREAGDAARRTARKPAGCFNPRPPLAKRATGRPRRRNLSLRVSIRARLSRSGRHVFSEPCEDVIEFQSAPASREAGDQPGRPPIERRPCFNPRPPLAKRATSVMVMLDTVTPPFQSAPASREAGDAMSLAALATELVSIRARLSRSGRPGLPAWPPSRRGFNPRPPLAKRATVAGVVGQRQHLVSIRARLSRSGRRFIGLQQLTGFGVSIRARLSRSGRRSTRAAQRADREVSIRARLSRSGRRQ